MSLINQALLTELINNTPWLRNDRNLCNRLTQQYSENSVSWNSVNRLIDDLDLVPYSLERNVQQPVNENKSPNLAFTGIVSVVPEPSDDQKRLSIDLIGPPSVNPPMRPTSLSKPAETAISNVNIVTKVTEFAGKNYIPLPLGKSKQKTGLQGLQAVFPLDRWRSLKIGKSASNNTQNSPVPINSESVANDSIESTNEVVSATEKANRRKSLVNRHLPGYIRDQLTQIKDNNLPDSPPTAPGVDRISMGHPLRVASNRSSADAGVRTDDNRISNLIVNSQSFYFKKNSQISLDRTDGSSVSDADKEYILPGSFNHSGEDYDHNNTYHQLDDETEGSELEEDDEDEYLFR